MNKLIDIVTIISWLDCCHLHDFPAFIFLPQAQSTQLYLTTPKLEWFNTIKVFFLDHTQSNIDTPGQEAILRSSHLSNDLRIQVPCVLNASMFNMQFPAGEERECKRSHREFMARLGSGIHHFDLLPLTRMQSQHPTRLRSAVFQCAQEEETRLIYI